MIRRARSGIGRARASVILALCLCSGAAVSCAHTGNGGPDTCGGYSLEPQSNKRFRLTVTAKVTEPPQWKVDMYGDPSPASFGGDGLEEAAALFHRLARERCHELGFRDSSGNDDLEWSIEKTVESVSTCVDPGAPGKRFYAIRLWGDHIRCVYSRYL